MPAAISAEVLLFAIGRLAILDDVFAFAVIAGDELSNHSSILSFVTVPLPANLIRAGLGPDRLQEYEVADPAWMNARGLIRYWQKRPNDTGFTGN